MDTDERKLAPVVLPGRRRVAAERAVVLADLLHPELVLVLDERLRANTMAAQRSRRCQFGDRSNVFSELRSNIVCREGHARVVVVVESEDGRDVLHVVLILGLGLAIPWVRHVCSK
jgi:hypothetical protein